MRRRGRDLALLALIWRNRVGFTALPPYPISIAKRSPSPISLLTCLYCEFSTRYKYVASKANVLDFFRWVYLRKSNRVVFYKEIGVHTLTIGFCPVHINILSHFTNPSEGKGNFIIPQSIERFLPNLFRCQDERNGHRGLGRRPKSFALSPSLARRRG